MVNGEIVHAGYDKPYKKVLVQRAGEKEWKEINHDR